jgi:hypothetical protein
MSLSGSGSTTYKERGVLMSLVLHGKVKGMRPVGGITNGGRYDGQSWNYVSMEVVDTLNGQEYSCQLRSNHDKYKEFVKVDVGQGPEDKKTGKKLDKLTLLKDWTGHSVKILIGATVPGERVIVDKDGGESTILVVRVYIDQLEDLGVPKVEGW